MILSLLAALSFQKASNSIFLIEESLLIRISRLFPFGGVFPLKKLNAFRREFLYLESFIIPCIICILALWAMHIAPFGEDTLLISDARSLYANYIPYWKGVLSGADSLLYSFSKGLGGNMVGVNAFHLLNPLYLLFAFADNIFLPTFYSIISILSLSCCGVTMFYMLNRLFGTRGSNLIFSTSYALIGFNVVNNWQMQWLSGVIVLPLIFLGIRNIFHKKSPLLYIFSLAFAIFSNFFIGYELCLVSVLFFVYFMILQGKTLDGKEKRRRTISFLISSLLAGGMTSFVWLPTVLSLVEGRAKQISLDDFAFTERFPLLSTAARLFSGAHSINELIDGVPAVFCGILVLALVVLFFMNKEISRREKAAALFLVAAFILSFQITTFSSVFQMFSRPNWFAFRYSFAFSFVLILIATKQFQYLDQISLRDTLRAGAILALFAVIVFHTEYEFVNGSAAVLDFALLAVMWAGFYLYKKKPETTSRQTLSLLLLLMVSINLYANYCLSVYSEKDWFTKNADYQDGTKALSKVVDKIQAQDGSFYRMESEIARPSLLNEPMAFGYYGVGYAGSCERQFVTHNMSRLGVTWFDMRNYYLTGMPASMDSFLGLKYVISRRDLNEEKNYQKLFDGTYDLQVFENPYALPVAMLSAEAVDSLSIADEPDVFLIQNRIWQTLTGHTEDLFTEEKDFTLTGHNPADPSSLTKQNGDDAAKAESDKENSANAILKVDDILVEQPGNPEVTEDNAYIKYQFTAQKDGPVYLYNYGCIDPNQGTQQATLQYVGTFHKGDIVTGKILYADGTVTPSVLQAATQNVYIAYADMDVLDKYAAQLQGQNVTIEQPEKNRARLTGTIETNAAQQLLFTIPYDKGLTLLIDGAPAQLNKAMDLFMSADIPAGSHTYELTFFPVGLKAGIIISCAAVILLAVWCGYRRRRS